MESTHSNEGRETTGINGREGDGEGQDDKVVYEASGAPRERKSPLRGQGQGQGPR